MTVIDEYLKKIEPDKRESLKRIRKIAKEVVPTAEDTISYGMPTLTYKGKAFLGFDVHKNHIGIYPYGGEVIEVFKDKLTPYEHSSGAIRVPFDTAFPDTLLKEIIHYRIKKLESK